MGKRSGCIITMRLAIQEIGYVSYRKALWILKLETINIYQGEGEVS
jgi:hypothetical protein